MVSRLEDFSIVYFLPQVIPVSPFPFQRVDGLDQAICKLIVTLMLLCMVGIFDVLAAVPEPGILEFGVNGKQSFVTSQGTNNCEVCKGLLKVSITAKSSIRLAAYILRHIQKVWA